MESPCVHCTRVKDPKNCENKLCRDWQAWFIDRWETMREQIRKEMDSAELTESGIPLGGKQYAHPHRVRDYLNNDPCDRCPCSKDLCHAPCPVKSAWLEKKGDVRK